MRWLMRLVLASFASMGIAVLLSFLPQLDYPNGSQHSNTDPGHRASQFQLAEGRLTNENLVDYMASVHWFTALSKVEWSHSILSVDFEASPGIGKHQIFSDLYEVIRFGLEDAGNVRQILIRVLLPSSVDGNGKLMLAVDVDGRRNSEIVSDLVKVRNHEMTSEQFIRSRFHVTSTRLWEESYRQ
jgi:hypothetical protein